MNPKLWGFTFWKAYFAMAEEYPAFLAIGEVLPCDLCRENFKKKTKRLVIDQYLSSRKSLQVWLVKLHNMIEKTNGGTPLTFSDALEKYSSYRAQRGGGASPAQEADENMFKNVLVASLLVSVGILLAFK
jgi:Erv1 / Alr family